MYDVIIIGGGPAGVSTGLYAKRAGFNVCIIAKGVGELDKASKIENYYGFENGITGKELQENGIKQAKNLGIKVVEKEVVGIQYGTTNEVNFEVKVANQGRDEKYEATIVVLATGSNRNKPNIYGIKEFEGRGVSYCAVCDASFYRNKNVAVLGNGDYAIEEIENLLPIANKVLMLTNGENTVENRKDLNINKKKIKEVRGDSKVQAVEFEDGTIEEIDGLFIAQGIASSTDFARKIGAKIENNNIAVNENMETTVNNLYACGDCTGGILQVSKAVYDGTKAGLAIIKKLRNNK